ncbi:unnamed protein product [Protopolystoma xenopodis]|uniref:Uncharacterized protein n=1 Tax=Protopolystoma xenopodis TaxID=117903 RepID=A0A3S5B3X9_9PLAT|nr:unnamed protein product [Protopolystoma xenopodis]
MDKWPSLRRHRELLVLAVIVYCFLGGLATTTSGGYFVFDLLDRHGAQISILFIVFCECVALCWFYGESKQFLLPSMPTFAAFEQGTGRPWHFGPTQTLSDGLRLCVCLFQ